MMSRVQIAVTTLRELPRTWFSDRDGSNSHIAVVVSTWVICVIMPMKLVTARLITWARQGRQFWRVLNE